MKIIATNKETKKTYEVLMFHVDGKLQVWVRKDNEQAWWEDADKYDYNYDCIKLS